MPAARTTRHKSLTRIDHPTKHTFGYLVRIGWNGVMHNKFFSDRKHGDRLGALAAALEWRNATERTLGKPRTEQPVVSNPRPGKSGIQGVRRLKDTRGENEYYEATWIITPGKMGRTRYSITKHGEAKARRLAIKARKLHEQQRWQLPRTQTVSVAVEPPPVKPVQSHDDQRWQELLAAAEARGAALGPPDVA